MHYPNLFIFFLKIKIKLAKTIDAVAPIIPKNEAEGGQYGFTGSNVTNKGDKIDILLLNK
jgi:hypothetical protein